MTEQMEAFLKGLADLLEEHEVEIEGTTNDVGPEQYCDGIEFTQTLGEQTDHTQPGYRPNCTAYLPQNIDATSIRKYIESSKQT